MRWAPGTGHFISKLCICPATAYSSAWRRDTGRWAWPSGPRAVYDEHLRIIDAISRNMPDEAEQFARQHVLEARLIIEQEAARNEFIPKWVVTASG